MKFEDWLLTRNEIERKAGEAVVRHNTFECADAHNGKCYIDLDEHTEESIKGSKYHYAVHGYEEEMYHNGKDMVDYPLGKGRFRFDTKNWQR